MQAILIMLGVIWGLPLSMIAAIAAPMTFSQRYRRFLMSQLING